MLARIGVEPNLEKPPAADPESQHPPGGVGGPTFTVTSTKNSGPGSLREAVVSANSAGSGARRRGV